MNKLRDTSESSLSSSTNESENLDSVGSELAENDALEDPRMKAATYLSKNNILELFRTLTSGLVYNRPTNSLQFMINEIDKINKAQEAKFELTVPDQNNPLKDDMVIEDSINSQKNL